MSIIVFGSINIDLTTYGPVLPHPAVTLFGSSYMTALAGKGSNRAVAAARTGAPTRLVARCEPLLDEAPRLLLQPDVPLGASLDVPTTRASAAPAMPGQEEVQQLMDGSAAS